MARLFGFPWITAALCIPAVVVLLAASLGWTPADLSADVGETGRLDLGQALHVVALGARSTALVGDADQRWRLLTAHFVHTSWLHLAFNLAFLFPVGAALEQILRRRDYAVLVLVSMVGSALASLIFTPQVSAGASGIVFGLLGAAVITGIRHRHRLGPQIRHHFGWWVLPFLLVTLGITLGNPAVDHGSHLGGLFCGLLYAPWMRIRLPRAIERSSPANAVALALCGLGLLIAPAIARGGAPIRVAVHPGWTADLPSAWTLRTGLLGEHEWSTAGGFVVLAAAEATPRPDDDLAQWYLDYQLRPLQFAGHADAIERLPVHEDTLLPVGATHLRFGLIREQTPMVRDVYFLPDPDHSPTKAMVSLEIPRSWTGAYQHARAALLASLRVWRGERSPSARVSLAALE